MRSTKSGSRSNARREVRSSRGCLHRRSTAAFILPLHRRLLGRWRPLAQLRRTSRRRRLLSRAQPAPRWWECIINFALVLWIVRVPLAMTAFGWLLLGWTSQAQDLFVEFARLSVWWMLWFLFVLTAVWALPTHYAARMLIDSDPRFNGRGLNATLCLKGSAKCMPRLLGFLTFMAVEFAIWRSHANMPSLDEINVLEDVDRALIKMALLVAAGAAAHVVWVIKRPRSFVLPGWLGRLNAKLGTLWQAISPGRVRGATDEESRHIGRLVLAGVFIIFLGIFLFGADRAGAIFPRAMAVPFILGGWLPFLSYLSGVGRQIRAPLIAGLIVLVAILAAVLGDNHSVRRIASGAERCLSSMNPDVHAVGIKSRSNV